MGSKNSALQLEQKAVRSVGIFYISRVHSSLRSALEKVILYIGMRFPLNIRVLHFSDKCSEQQISSTSFTYPGKGNEV